MRIETTDNDKTYIIQILAIVIGILCIREINELGMIDNFSGLELVPYYIFIGIIGILVLSIYLIALEYYLEYWDNLQNYSNYQIGGMLWKYSSILYISSGLLTIIIHPLFISLIILATVDFIIGCLFMPTCSNCSKPLKDEDTRINIKLNKGYCKDCYNKLSNAFTIKEE